MEKLAQSLHVYLHKNGFQEQLQERLYLKIWPNVVGEEIVRYTKPVKMEKGNLIVEVSDSTWLYHLTLLKAKIMKDFNAEAGRTVVQDIKFINAGFGFQQKEDKKRWPLGKTKKLAATKHLIKGIKLKKEETKEIEEVISIVPDFLQTSLRKLCKNHYRQQVYNKIQGAKQCRRCLGLFFKLEEQLCFYCQQDLDAWSVVLDNFFKQTPWEPYEVLHREHPLLDAPIFNLYKGKLLTDYKQYFTAALAKNKFGDDEQNKALKETIQHYVLLFTGREPAAVEKGHIFTALKDFPGLYQLFYS